MPASSNKLPSPLTLRLSQDEWDVLRRDVANGGLSTSEYVRARLFDENTTVKRRRQVRPIKDNESLGKVMALLGKTHIASNLNQIAKAANAGYLDLTPEVTSAILEACADIDEIRQHLLAALGLKETPQ